MTSNRSVLMPNRNVLPLIALLAAIWYAGAGQNNGAAYLLCFGVAGIAIISAPHCWANLQGVRVAVGKIQPVFVGEQLEAPLHFSGDGRARASISAWTAGVLQSARIPGIPAEGTAEATLSIEATVRGRYDSLPVVLTTLYPLGFFTATLELDLPQTYHIYPRPSGNRPLPSKPSPGLHSRAGVETQGEDFSGVREWQVGESMRHVDWKAVARGQRLQVKQWSGVFGPEITLAWNDLDGVPAEERLEQLANWVLQAERSGLRYALEVPEAKVPAGRGSVHLHDCLRRLAEFGHASRLPENA